MARIPRRHAAWEVYPVREDSRLLARFARPSPGDRVLEVGCGRGLASLVSARHGAGKVVATDLNRSALLALSRRARDERLPVDPVRTDLAVGLRRFDLVLSNPPYLPTRSHERAPDPGEHLALDGGPDGCRVLSRLVRALPSLLEPNGRAYVLVSSRQSPRRLQTLRRRWRRETGSCDTVAHERWGRETLSVWRFTRGTPRSGRLTRGTGGRRRVPRPTRSSSSRGVGSGRTIAPGAA